MATEIRAENERSAFERIYIEVTEGDHPILRLFLRTMGAVLLLAIPSFLLSWFLPDGGPLIITMLSASLLVVIVVVVFGFATIGIALVLMKGYRQIRKTIRNR